MLEVDGVKLAQSAAIEYYAAGLAGLLPADPFLAAKTQEMYQYINVSPSTHTYTCMSPLHVACITCPPGTWSS